MNNSKKLGKRIGLVVLAIPVLVVLFYFLVPVLSPRPDTLGVTEGKFSACSSRPNNVSSQTDMEKHKIAPIAYEVPPPQAKEKLLAVLKGMKNATIVVDQENYLHVEFRTDRFRFVDDTEFYINPEEKVIHVKSGARLGYRDFGVNRERVEQIRALFQTQLVTDSANKVKKD